MSCTGRCNRTHDGFVFADKKCENCAWVIEHYTTSDVVFWYPVENRYWIRTANSLPVTFDVAVKEGLAYLRHCRLVASLELPMRVRNLSSKEIVSLSALEVIMDDYESLPFTGVFTNERA